MSHVVALTGVGVYHDSDTSRWHFDQLNDHSYRFNQKDYYTDINEFAASTYSLKFAGYHVPFPENRAWIYRFHQSYKQVSHSFIFCSELHGNTVDQLIELDLPNVSIFICGAINEYQFQHAKVYQWMDWFHTTSYNYRVHYPDLLPSKLVVQENKPKMFDALLGVRRGNRMYVYNHIKNSAIESQVLMTLLNDRNQIPVDTNAEEFIMETEGLELIPNRSLDYTITPVRYYGKEMSLSQVVPISVYNQTYYTIVTETNHFNHFNFYTEKTTKPLIAGRLFITFGGQYSLRNLRSMGFKTFGAVIDESYDDEPDTNKRWNMAMHQVELLCQQDPVTVYKKIADVIEHNRRNILERDWNREFSITLATIVSSYLTVDHRVVY